MARMIWFRRNHWPCSQRPQTQVAEHRAVVDARQEAGQMGRVRCSESRTAAAAAATAAAATADAAAEATAAAAAKPALVAAAVAMCPHSALPGVSEGMSAYCRQMQDRRCKRLMHIDNPRWHGGGGYSEKKMKNERGVGGEGDLYVFSADRMYVLYFDELEQAGCAVTGLVIVLARRERFIDTHTVAF